ncbi:MAG: hypothetical protein PVJ52_00225 [Candidatus Woesebacteria bacterium]|jgi:hypothetical protein
MRNSPVLAFINKTFNFNLGNFKLEPTYWQAAMIIVLLFLVVWSLARIRYLYVNWSLGRSAIAMLFWGFVLTLLLEGFLILGGKTLLTEIFGWKNPPKPISTALDMGRNKMIDVLGVNKEIPASYAQNSPTLESIILDFQNLSQEDQRDAREYICSP